MRAEWNIEKPWNLHFIFNWKIRNLFYFNFIKIINFSRWGKKFHFFRKVFRSFWSVFLYFARFFRSFHWFFFKIVSTTKFWLLVDFETVRNKNGSFSKKRLQGTSTCYLFALMLFEPVQEPDFTGMQRAKQFACCWTHVHVVLVAILIRTYLYTRAKYKYTVRIYALGVLQFA